MSQTQPPATATANNTTVNASNALQVLAETVADHEADVAQYSQGDNVQSDEENESSCPVFDRFYESGGVEGIKNMTNFTPSQFNQLFNYIEEKVNTLYLSGRGRRTTHTPKDIFFMTLCTLKHGMSWAGMAYTFNIKAPSFEKIIVGFIRLVSPTIYEELVLRHQRRFPMAQMIRGKQTFHNFPAARYATDVTLQQSFRPSGSLQEGRLFFSGKHKLYGVKVEASVLPNGQCIDVSNYHRGSVSDLTIFQNRANMHKNLT